MWFSVDIQQLWSVHNLLLVTRVFTNSIWCLCLVQHSSAITREELYTCTNIYLGGVATYSACMLLHQWCAGAVWCGKAHARRDTKIQYAGAQVRTKSGVMLTQVTGTCWWSSEISIARTGAGSQNSLASFVYCLLPNESHFLSLNFLTEKTERLWICVNPGDHVTLTTVAIKISTTPPSYTRLITSRLTSPVTFLDTSNYPTSLTHLPHISHSSPSHLSHTLSHLSPMSLTSLTHLPHISHPSPSHLSSISLSHSSPCRFWTLSASFTV